MLCYTKIEKSHMIRKLEMDFALPALGLHFQSLPAPAQL